MTPLRSVNLTRYDARPEAWVRAMRRREFIAALGAATATWPLAAHAQQPMMPVIGYFNSATSDGFSAYLSALRQRLKEGGYIEGENVAIEYRWADNQPERLPDRPTSFIDKSG